MMLSRHKCKQMCTKWAFDSWLSSWDQFLLYLSSWDYLVKKGHKFPRRLIPRPPWVHFWTMASLFPMARLVFQPETMQSQCSRSLSFWSCTTLMCNSTFHLDSSQMRVTQYSKMGTRVGGLDKYIGYWRLAESIANSHGRWSVRKL